MSGECSKYTGIERRKHCEMVVTVNQKFNDFIERYERDQAVTKGFREYMDKSLSDVSVSLVSLGGELREMRKPYKILIWIITIVTGAFVIEIAQWIFHFLKTKITWS
jgi:hypothetical protein